MLVSLKPVKGEAFQIEVDDSATVGDLKNKIAEAKADFPVAQQKLIFQGKILQDGQTLKEANITSEGFVVVMVTKAAGQPADQPAQPQASTAPSTGASVAAAATLAATTPGPASAVAPAGGAASAPAASLPTIVTELRQSPRWRELAQRVVTDPSSLPRMLAALRPQHAQLLQALTENIQGFVQMCRDETGGVPPGMPGMGNPQFRQIAAALAQNPQMLQQMAQSDPELAAALQQNPQQVAAALAMAASGGMPGGMQHIPQIELTEEETAAVERLCALGYDRNMVIEVYVGCGKNEELAANILMDEAQGQ